MSWPSILPNSAAFDADADSVAASRPELKKMSDAVNSIQDFINPAGITSGQMLYYDEDSSNGRLIVVDGTAPVDFAGTPTRNDRAVVFTGGVTTGTITPDAANGPVQRITLTGNITMNAFANAKAGQRITMIFRQPAAGSTFDLTSNMQWENGSESLTQINSAVDTADILFDGTDYFAEMKFAHGSVEVYPVFFNPLTEDLDVNNFSIINNVTNGHITLTPNGTGDVRLSADTVRVGDSNVNAIITTNGTGDLILNTNAGTTSSTITIKDGERGSIILQTDKTTPSSNPLSTIRLNSDLVVLDNAGAGTIIGTPLNASTLKGELLQIVSGAVLLSTGGFSGSNVPRIELGGATGTIKLLRDATIFGSEINFDNTFIINGSGMACSDLIIRQVEFKDYAETVHNQGNVTGSFSITVSNGNTQRMRLTGNVTFTGFTDAREGQTVTLILTQDGTGNRTFTEGLDSANRMLFAGGVSTLSTAANAVDIMSISFIAGTFLASINKNYS